MAVNVAYLQHLFIRFEAQKLNPYYLIAATCLGFSEVIFSMSNDYYIALIRYYVLCWQVGEMCGIETVLAQFGSDATL